MHTLWYLVVYFRSPYPILALTPHGFRVSEKVLNLAGLILELRNEGTGPALGARIVTYDLIKTPLSGSVSVEHVDHIENVVTWDAEISLQTISSGDHQDVLLSIPNEKSSFLLILQFRFPTWISSDIFLFANMGPNLWGLRR